MTPSDRD